MAERRMFSKKIVSSARFLKMPMSSQALYFHLGINADDDGICEAFPIMRMTGATEDDLRILVSKEFIMPLNEDLVCYITDWGENNRIRSDRKVDSIYQSLLIQVLPDVEIQQKTQRADLKKKVGRPVDVQWTTNGQSMDGLGKDSIGKDSIVKNNTIIVDTSANQNPKNTQKEGNHQNESSPVSVKKRVFIEFPLIGGDSAAITEEWCDEMQNLYGQGGVNVRFEIQRAKNWCINNKKYKKLWGKFLTNWFDNCLSKGGSKVESLASGEEISNARKLEELREKEDRELQDLIDRMKSGF